MNTENATFHVQSARPSAGVLAQFVDKAVAASTSSYIASFLVLVVLACSATRILTGRQCTLYSGANVPGNKKVGLLPYWIPVLGHSFSFFTRFQEYLGDVMINVRDGTFSLNLANNRINVVSAPSLAKQVLSVHAPVDARALVAHFMKTALGDGGAVGRMDQDVVFGPIHRVLYQLNREPFVSHAVQRTADGVERLSANLVNFDSRKNGGSNAPLWEVSGRVKILDDKQGLAEVSLHPLIRDFVGAIALPALMGEKFFQNFPNTLADIWTFDRAVNLLITGLPRWLCALIPSLSAAIAARERLVKSVVEFEDALRDIADGKPPTERWGDLSDVSNVMVDRAKAWRDAKADRAAYGSGDAVIMWAMVVNANQVIFWVLWYIYRGQGEGLLDEVREEIKDFVDIDSTGDTPRLKLDIDSLMTRCPLLQSTFLETMRMTAFSTSFKSVQRDFTVTESAEDAAVLGKTGPQSYTIPKGEMICLPFGAHQMDRRYFKDPTVFDARRFWVVKGEKGEKGEKAGSEKKTSENVSVEYGTMKVWGGGSTMCKGQKFAEREVMVFVAAILTLWDMEPAGGDGKWKFPGHKQTAGTVQPKADVRVRLTRRKV